MKLELNTYYKISEVDVDNFAEAICRDFNYILSKYEISIIKATCDANMFAAVSYSELGYFSGLRFDGTEVEYIPSDVDWV